MGSDTLTGGDRRNRGVDAGPVEFLVWITLRSGEEETSGGALRSVRGPKCESRRARGVTARSFGRSADCKRFPL